jgi:hypothetical protein
LNPNAYAAFDRAEELIMGQNDNVVLLSPESLIEHVKEERERLVEQIVRSEQAIAQSRELIGRIDRMLAAAERK